jgi:Ca-activated chloride channel family protein
MLALRTARMLEVRNSGFALHPKALAKFTSLLLAVCFHSTFRVSHSALAAQGGSGGYVISKTLNLVELPVTVKDRKGRFVSGLEQPNFRVYENGQMQGITLFRSEDIPVAAGLVVDHSGSMGSKRDEVMEGAKAFVQASNPQNREFVVNFSDTVTFGLPASVPFTSNLEDLQAALLATPASGKTALYDAVAAALERLQTDHSDRKVLVLISDGGNNASEHDFKQVLRMAQGASVVIYAIGLFEEYSADQNPKTLKKFSEETGGKAYFPNSAAEVVSVCQQIAADIRHQYTLGYSPPDSESGGYRKVQVSATALGRGKLFVHTRTGYFLPYGITGR